MTHHAAQSLSFYASAAWRRQGRVGQEGGQHDHGVSGVTGGETEEAVPVTQAAAVSAKLAAEVSSEQDREYMAAAKAGDTKTAKRLVDEAAKRSRYMTWDYGTGELKPWHHGTNRKGGRFKL